MRNIIGEEIEVYLFGFFQQVSISSTDVLTTKFTICTMASAEPSKIFLIFGISEVILLETTMIALLISAQKREYSSPGLEHLADPSILQMVRDLRHSYLMIKGMHVAGVLHNIR